LPTKEINSIIKMFIAYEAGLEVFLSTRLYTLLSRSMVLLCQFCSLSLIRPQAS